jgi:hypothetical protein
MDNKKWYYDEIMSAPYPLGNAGRPVPALLAVELAFIPKNAKNVDAAKDFLRYLIQPATLDGYMKEAKGRWLPVMPEAVKTDPCWGSIRPIRIARSRCAKGCWGDAKLVLRLQSRLCAGQCGACLCRRLILRD